MVGITKTKTRMSTNTKRRLSGAADNSKRESRPSKKSPVRSIPMTGMYFIADWDGLAVDDRLFFSKEDATKAMKDVFDGPEYEDYKEDETGVNEILHVLSVRKFLYDN